MSAPVSGLSAGTTYHYRLVALVGFAPYAQYFLGADKTFTTQPSSGPGSGNKTGSLVLPSKRLVVKGNKVKVRLECQSSRACRGTLSITTANAVGTVLRRVRCVSGKQFTIAPGAKRKVRAKVRMRCLALLASSTHGRRGAFLKVSLSTGQPDFSTGVTLVLG